MTNEEYEAQERRYKELETKYYSTAQMTVDEMNEFLALRDIYDPVEESE